MDPRYEDAVAGILEYQQPYVAPFSESGWKTIFTSPYRFAVVDLSDVRVRAGLSIAKQTILAMNQTCKDNGIHFIVALLPTKEAIFQKKVQDTSRYKLYAAQIDSENKVRSELKALFKEAVIDFVDPLLRLQEADVQPTFENADGYPNVAGQEIIAAAVYDFMKQKSLPHGCRNPETRYAVGKWAPRVKSFDDAVRDIPDGATSRFRRVCGRRNADQSLWGGRHALKNGY